MSTVPEIKQAIAKLSPREYYELMAELFPHRDDAWDQQMKADAEAGKFCATSQRVLSELATG